jgi:Flp pilus assembly protein TadD
MKIRPSLHATQVTDNENIPRCRARVEHRVVEPHGSDQRAVKVQAAETLLAACRAGDAEAVSNEALRLNAHAEGAHYLLAQIAEQRRDGAGAEREYREEIRLCAWDCKVRFNLALLLGQRNEHQQQVQLLESTERIAPEFSEVDGSGPARSAVVPGFVDQYCVTESVRSLVPDTLLWMR